MYLENKIMVRILVPDDNLPQKMFPINAFNGYNNVFGILRELVKKVE